MSKKRRGNYIFLAWVGDHTPRHIHVYRDSKFIVKWDLENQQIMKGSITRKILHLIEELDNEGEL